MSSRLAPTFATIAPWAICQLRPASPSPSLWTPTVAHSIVKFVSRPEETGDPIGDGVHSPVKGVVHRYPDRVLLKPVHVCAAYCRFCFRRKVVGRERGLSRGELAAAIAYIRAHREIWEVILTGGDPLVLSVRRLGEVIRRIAAH